MFDAYGGSAFPGVGDILYNINEQVKIAFLRVTLPSFKKESVEECL